MEYGEQAARLDSKEQLEQGHGFHRTLSDQEAPKTAPLGSVRYDLIGKLVEETKLTRATIAAILQRMAPQKFAMFRLNPEEFILKTAKIINDQMATQIIEHITYNKLDAAYDTDIFTSANLRGKLGLNAMEANRSLYSHIIYDSENEKRFAGELDVNAKVAVYVKLPGGFSSPRQSASIIQTGRSLSMKAVSSISTSSPKRRATVMLPNCAAWKTQNRLCKSALCRNQQRERNILCR